MHLYDCLVQPLAHNLATNHDLAAVDVDVLLLQRLGNILARHRTEEAAVLSNAYRDLHLDLFELRRHQFCLVDRHRLLACLRARLRLGDVQVRAARGQRQFLWQEEVAPVAVRHLHNLALFSDILDISL